MERARIVEADVGADRRDRIGRIGQPLDRDVAPQFVLSAWNVVPSAAVAAQRAHRAMQVLGRLTITGRSGNASDRYCRTR